MVPGNSVAVLCFLQRKPVSLLPVPDRLLLIHICQCLHGVARTAKQSPIGDGRFNHISLLGIIQQKDIRIPAAHMTGCISHGVFLIITVPRLFMDNLHRIAEHLPRRFLYNRLGNALKTIHHRSQNRKILKGIGLCPVLVPVDIGRLVIGGVDQKGIGRFFN